MTQILINCLIIYYKSIWNVGRRIAHRGKRVGYTKIYLSKKIETYSVPNRGQLDPLTSIAGFLPSVLVETMYSGAVKRLSILVPRRNRLTSSSIRPNPIFPQSGFISTQSNAKRVTKPCQVQPRTNKMIISRWFCSEVRFFVRESTRTIQHQFFTTTLSSDQNLCFLYHIWIGQ